MELYRKIEKDLKEWANSKYALLLCGARQVGKTYIIKKFLKENYGNFYYLNLYENPSAIEVLIDAVNTEDFLLRLTALSSDTLNEDTCIFIDEIQEFYTYLSNHKQITKYYDLITASKFIALNTKHKLVYSGSLLRLEMNEVISNPVGYLLPLSMYPLDFEEFVLANKINPKFIEIVKDAFINKTVVPDYIHNIFLDLFNKYLLVGGMPQAVSEYIDKRSFTAVSNAHKTIDAFIRKDISKYAEDNEKLKIKEIYNLIPSELNSISKRFIFSHISDHKKNDNEQLSFTWLNDAGVTIPVYVVDETVIPLKASSSRNKLKLFHEDVGLLTYLLMDASIKEDIIKGNININYGSIYENVVAELMHCHNFSELYYYNNKKNGEIDFLIQHENKVLPIEIKSGKDYERHVALNNLLDSKNYNVNEAFIFCNHNYKKENNKHYFPIYMIDFLRKDY